MERDNLDWRRACHERACRFIIGEAESIQGDDAQSKGGEYQSQ
jgi:hypothetical protein